MENNLSAIDELVGDERVSFTFQRDSEEPVPAFISRSALDVLGGGSVEDLLRIFGNNRNKIAAAALKKLRDYPDAPAIALGSDDF